MKFICLSVCLIVGSYQLIAQGVGIGTTMPTAALDVQGDLILKSGELVLPDGVIYNADINTTRYNLYKLIGPTGNFVLAGILAAEDDRMITLYNRSGHSMEVYNEDPNAAPGDMIYTGTGTTFAIYAGGTVTLRYDAALLQWEIVSSHYNSLDYFGGSWAGTANDIYNTNSGNIGVGTSTPPEKLSIAGNMDISGEIKNAGVAGQSGEVLQSNGNGTMSWMSMTQNGPGDVGYGSFGCEMNNVSDFNPVMSSEQSTGRLGYCADIQGDYAILGAPYTTVNGVSQVGAAYIYYYDGTNWIEQQKLIADDGVLSDEFGTSVTIHGTWAAVAAPRADFGGNTNRGAVYVFQFNGVEWVQTQKIIDVNGGNGDNYGWSVSMDDTQIAIGVITDNGDTGAIQIFTYDGTEWLLQHHVVPGGGVSGDWFGSSVSINGSTMVVGSDSDTYIYSSEGSVYFFTFDGVNWIQQQKLYCTVPGTDFRFGKSISLSGNNVIVGSASDRVQFFRLENGVWRASRYFTGIGSTLVSISEDFAISSTGKLFKSTPQSWFIYETAGDPGGTSEGAVF